MVALAPNTSETSPWDILDGFPKLHSRAREVKTARCTEAPHSKSLDRVEIRLTIYESCVGLESFTRDPIGFDAGGELLYEYVDGNPLDGLDPEGLTPVHALCLVGACGGCLACLGPGAVACAAYSEDSAQFIDCYSYYLSILPTWHQWACGGACTTCGLCIAKKILTPKPKPPVVGGGGGGGAGGGGGGAGGGGGGGSCPKGPLKGPGKPQGLSCTTMLGMCLGTSLANQVPGANNSRCFYCNWACRASGTWPGITAGPLGPTIRCDFWNPMYWPGGVPPEGL